MIFKAKRKQLAALVLHMSVMRKNIKRGLKSNYGSKEGKELVKVFDKVKSQLQEALLQLEDDLQESTLIFEENELTLIHSFLSWYVTEIDVTYQKAGKQLDQEEKEQIELLKDFNKQIESMK
jgi:hypothetical protein